MSDEDHPAPNAPGGGRSTPSTSTSQADPRVVSLGDVRATARERQERQKMLDAQAAVQREQDIDDWLEGRDTEGARRAIEKMQQVQRRNREARRAGDPLNLSPEHKKLARQEAKEAARAARRARIAPLPRTLAEALTHKVVVIDPLNNQEVVGFRGGFSLRGYPNHVKRAADRFVTDFQMAYCYGLRGASLEMKVDGGGGGAGSHIAMMDAQRRMQLVARRLDRVQFQLVVCTLIHGKGLAEIHKAGGPEHRVLRHELSKALNRMATFYGSKKARPDPTLRAISKIYQAMGRDADSGKGDAVTSIMETLRFRDHEEELV